MTIFVKMTNLFLQCNIQAVGTQTWIGNDSYTGTTGTLTKGGIKQLYSCTASNGVPSVTGRTGLNGAYMSCVNVQGFA